MGATKQFKNLLLTLPFLSFLGFGTPKDLLKCETTNTQSKETLLLSYTILNDTRLEYVLQKLDEQNNVISKLMIYSPDTVHWGAGIIAVDHFESHVGDLQLIAVFRPGSSKAKSFTFFSSFGIDANNAGSTGLLRLASPASTTWSCERL